MRLYEIEGNQGSPEEVSRNIAETIVRDCLPFLTEIKFKPGRDLYRGLTEAYSHRLWQYYTEPLTVRTDRRPLDSSQEEHDIVNEWMFSKFGWRPRSEGLFATGSYDQASTFGVPHAIFPIGPYKYVWAEDIEDMTSDLRRATGAYTLSDITSNEYKKRFSGAINQMLANAKWHDSNGMNLYFSSKWNREITFKVPSYYAIPVRPQSKDGVSLITVTPMIMELLK